ncbi:MAG: glycerol-3-phosphate 1-O-acyltransferase PlsY [Rhodocyclaceae bacterium]|nr:glycerol-3-phosphate 1-O-acyltransferase PlsY [Rhodocyclaceae bacterium]MCB1964209.1 glycerol-3-phosphate 1-O-acyltransferase PlsY [Rhodocyclaceae bacterium]
MTPTTLALVALAYLIGAIPFAVVVSKLFGLSDPRHYGSGNPGATNVLRSGNKSAAALTLLGDAAKGWVAVWVMQHWGPGTASSVALAGAAAFIGHVFPVTLGFKGGKGVATALGVLAGFSGWLALACMGVWLALALILRYSSAAALGAAVAAPLAAQALIGEAAISGASVFMTGILIWRHAGNIKRLLAGTEPKIGSKKKPPAAS